MTTIAYRSGVLASDSRSMCGGWKSPYAVEKLRRLPDGTVCGVAGDYARGMRFIDWLAQGENGDAPDTGEASIIRMLKDGSIRIYEEGGSFLIRPDYAAWGSGSPPANAAMHMGADARKAIEVAAMFDDSTGGEIVTMSCDGVRPFDGFRD